MANEEHVALLRQGVDAWNAWRRGNPDVSPDLTKADLRKAKLDGINLRWADLQSVPKCHWSPIQHTLSLEGVGWSHRSIRSGTPMARSEPRNRSPKIVPSRQKSAVGR